MLNRVKTLMKIKCQFTSPLNSPFPSSRMTETWCRNCDARARLSALHPIKHGGFEWKNNMQWRFLEINGSWIEKLYAKERYRYIIKRWRERNVESLIAWFMPENSDIEAEETGWFCGRPHKELQTSEGKLPDPKTLIAWTHNFFKIPEFTFGDFCNYLVGKEDHSSENLRSFESRDGHVVDR